MYNYFTGKIIETSVEPTTQDLEYSIKAMVPSGLMDWKWPDLEDVMWYGREDVIKLINEPTMKNKRGIYLVPEMNKYKSFC